MSSLNLNDYTPSAQSSGPLTGEQLEQAKQVKTLGIVALVLAIVGLCIPFLADIAAFFLAKHAMNLSRRNLVPIEYEKPAYWAYRVSIVGMIWWVVFMLRAVL
jgi:accessory gene regulator protein AgrB